MLSRFQCPIERPFLQGVYLIHILCMSILALYTARWSWRLAGITACRFSLIYPDVDWQISRSVGMLVPVCSQREASIHRITVWQLVEGSLLNPSSLHLSPLGSYMWEIMLVATDQYFSEVVTHHVDMVSTFEECCSMKMQSMHRIWHIIHHYIHELGRPDLVEFKLSIAVI